MDKTVLIRLEMEVLVVVDVRIILFEMVYNHLNLFQVLV